MINSNGNSSAQENSLIHNRGFLYGDGLFETMILKDGKIRFLNSHFERLCNGLKALKMTISTDFTIEKIEKTILDLLAKNNIHLMIIH